MDASAFLTHIVAPGAYYAFAFKRVGSDRLGHRFFPQSDLPAAVNWLRHIADEADVWYAVASFKEARRLQANAENIRCFWYDADISRPGDGKAHGTVWNDAKELIDWLGSVKARLPWPNLWISSGYGMHLYWVLDTPLPAPEWTEHARKFRSLLGNLGARGDISISADSARILRPPETFNYKVVNDRQTCRDITPLKLALPTHYECSKFLARLGLTIDSKLPPRPDGLGSPGSRLLDAAKANLPKLPIADFATIASHCPQVRKTLDEGGEHDSYELWHLMSNLAFFCEDHDAAHAIACKHQTYSEDDTDSKLALTEREHAEKNSFGAPSCESFDLARKGICQSCPHVGKIKSPYSLGFQLVLPPGYAQTTESLNRADFKKDQWVILVKGNVDNPQLYHLGGGVHRLTFDYIEPSNPVPWHVAVNEAECGTNPREAIKSFVTQGISLGRSQALHFADFAMAWIKELRDACKTVEAPPSFGWVHDEETNEYTGVSIAGTFYHADGSETLAQPGDPTVHKNYQPRGNPDTWRRAAEFVIADRPELHAILGASFAAPLMEFVGESGIMSVWSQKSGARKTSAFRVGTAIWCNPITGMSAIRDTTNSVQQSLGETKIMPVFWDEIHTANKDQIATMVEMFFNITQGRGRARLDQRMEQRSVGYWRTLLILSANKPSAESIEQDRAHTNAGTIRVFEYHIDPQPGTDQNASSIVQSVEKNFGHTGRAFARWLACNVEEIQATVKAVRSKLYRDVPDIKPEERFNVAVIVGVTTGAMLARKLDLLSLDVSGVYKFLKEILYTQRKDQQAENPVSEAERLVTKFDRFVADHTDELLVTQSFSSVGRPKVGIHTDRIRIVHEPPRNKSARAMIHIGLNEQEMRVDYGAFKRWCSKSGETRISLWRAMELGWKAERTRAVLAIGTEWASGGKVDYIKINLSLPDLQHHLNWGTPAPSSNVVPFTAAE